MELYELTENLKLIGMHVASFPAGIEQAFGKLMKQFGDSRAYYGISWMDDHDNVVYYAMTTENTEHEGGELGFESIAVPQGTYRCETVLNWMQKTNCIKDVFHELMQNSRPDMNKPCIEWYKSDDELLCMVPAF